MNKMNSQDSNNTDDELFEAFELSMEELNDLNQDYEHLRSIFEVALGTVSIDDVEQNIFEKEMPKLKSTCAAVFMKIKALLSTECQDKDTALEVKNLLQVYTNLLNLSQCAVKYVQEKILFVNVFSLPQTISQILLDTFTHCKESENIYGVLFEALSELLSTLFKKCAELQSLFLKLINSFLMYDLTNEKELQFLVGVASNIAIIGEVVSDLDLKTSLEVWKGYLTLTNMHRDHLKDCLAVSGPLRYLCCEIIHQLEKLISGDDVEKLLKVSNFYLKTVIKLCELFVDSIGDAHYNLFELLVILNQYSFPYLKWKKFEEKTVDSIQMYLTTGSEPLLNVLLEDRVFVRTYFKNITGQIVNEERRIGAILLSSFIIKKAMYKDREIYSMWFSSDPDSNIVYVLFSLMDVSHVELSSEIPVIIPTPPGAPRRIGSLYEHLILHMGSAIISFDESDSKTMQELMLRNILQLNPWKALFTMDLWCIFARYANEDFCFNQLLFLLETYSELRHYKHKLEVKFLCNLVNRLYKFLSKDSMQSLAERYPCFQHPYIWAIIGLNNHPDVNTAQTVCDSLLQQIDSVLNHKRVEEFNKLCDLLDLLSTYSFSNEKLDNLQHLLAKIVHLWSLNFEGIEQKPWLASFVNVLSKMTASVASYFTNGDIKKILYNINELESKSTSVKLSVIVILHSLGSKHLEDTPERRSVFELIKSLFTVLLKDQNALVREEALETFSFFAYNTKHESIIRETVGNDGNIRQVFSNHLRKSANSQILNEHLKSQRINLLNHKCAAPADATEPQQKKQKINHDVDLSTLLQRLKFDCNSLVEYCESDPLPCEARADLLPTLTKLLTYLEK